MKRLFIKPTALASIALATALIWACNDNKDQLSPAQKQANAESTAEDNSQIIYATQEMMDVTSGAFAEKGITEGRAITGGREMTWGCNPSISGNFNINTSIADSVIYTGSITVDYGTGENCDALQRRTGKITDNFVYAISLKNNSLFTIREDISFVGFKKDSVQFDGNVILAAATKSPTTVEAKGAKLSYADGTSAQWNGVLSFEYERVKNTRNWGGGMITVTGSLSGKSRSNTNFSALISSGIVFKNTCSGRHQYIPVSGVIDINSDGIDSKVDYGAGICDKMFTITTGGTTTIHYWDKAAL
ncbi:MAG: hypothetical protein HOP08_04215 [Cyclobacteriaceae bacterium]|nr:hypothetical protein [Cyclobacteriaceae bacterium]